MISAITLPTITIASDGTGAATSRESINGYILSIQINFTSAGTPTTTISNAASGVIPARTLLTITGSGTDAIYNVRHVVHDETGTVITYDGTREVHDAIVAIGKISATVASGTEAGTVVITVYYREA